MGIQSGELILVMSCVGGITSWVRLRGYPNTIIGFLQGGTLQDRSGIQRSRRFHEEFLGEMGPFERYFLSCPSLLSHPFPQIPTQFVEFPLPFHSDTPPQNRSRKPPNNAPHLGLWRRLQPISLQWGFCRCNESHQSPDACFTRKNRSVFPVCIFSSFSSSLIPSSSLNSLSSTLLQQTPLTLP